MTCLDPSFASRMCTDGSVVESSPATRGPRVRFPVSAEPFFCLDYFNHIFVSYLQEQLLLAIVFNLYIFYALMFIIMLYWLFDWIMNMDSNYIIILHSVNNLGFVNIFVKIYIWSKSSNPWEAQFLSYLSNQGCHVL